MNSHADDISDLDDMSRQLRQEALQALEDEKELCFLLHHTVLAPGVRTFEDAVATTITYRLLQIPCNRGPPSTTDGSPIFCPNSLRGILADALTCDEMKEDGHSMAQAVRKDAQAVCDRDPAVESLLEVVLFLKGFAALVCHRAAHRKWHSSQQAKKGKKSMVALWLQSQASAVFGMDIHPAATLGAGILLDHGTGLVIGETATVGDGCTILHGVTLGGTGKDSGVDRHPKVGKDVLIGANASLLGNIPVGDGAKIGAGSVVLRAIPGGATAVGAPAKIIGHARESKPGSEIDETLHEVSRLHKSISSSTVSTTIMTSDNNEEVSGSFIIDTDSDDNNKKETKENGTERTDGNRPDANHGNGNNNKQNPICPYREYLHLAKSAPPGSITLLTLRRLLPCHKLGEILFSLDKRDVGYIKPEDFFSPETESLIQKKTGLPPAKVSCVLTKFRQNWEAEQQQQQQRSPAKPPKGEKPPQSVSATA